ncbi:MAG: tetratricopeptide repeat protein, partial [Pseudomonadales bacterium]|nr:tetratricopeptide repeat protein [Pseudomonadales bacterium]
TKVEALLGRGKFNSALQTLTQHGSAIPQQDALYARARALAGLGQLDEANETLRELRGIAPDNIDAIVAQADVALLQDNNDAANGLLERITDIDPEHIDLRMLRAKMSIKASDFASAEKQLSDALIQLPQADTLTPKKATILSALADVLVKQGRSAEALVYMRVLAEAFPGFEVAQERYRESVALFEKGMLDQAKTELEALLSEYPNFDSAAVLLAVIQFQQGDFEQAADQLNESVDPELVHPEITRMTALSNLRSNRPQQVLTMLDAFPGTQKDARLLAIYGTSAMAVGQTEKGLTALQQAIKLEAGLSPAYIALAAYYNRADPPQREKALELLRTAYANNSQNPVLAKRLVSQLVLTGNAQQAEKIVSQRLSAGNKDLDALSLAAAFFASQKQFDKAEQYYAEVLKQDPANYAAAVQQGIVAAVSGKPFEQVLAKLKHAATIAPGRTNAYEYMLRLVKNDNQLQSVKVALAELEEKVGQRTGSAVLLAFLAARGDIDQASTILDTLNESNTEPEVLERARFAFDVNKARRELAEKNYESAKLSVFSALRSRPQSPELLGMLGQIEIANQNYAETEKIIAQVEGIDSATAKRLQGELHEAQGNKAEAAKSYLEAWQQRPSEGLA